MSCGAEHLYSALFRHPIWIILGLTVSTPAKTCDKIIMDLKHMHGANHWLLKLCNVPCPTELLTSIWLRVHSSVL
jgi:hypothetical protein